ncbi:unnamed protein product [Effrenium voratum]|nr:unnamed protein product [Effrenium voratum]
MHATCCAAHFGVLLGGKTGLEHPELQALEMDSLAFIDTDAANLRSLRRVSLVQARDHVLERIGSPYESEGLDDEDSENEPEAEGEGEGEFSIDRKFKSSAKREEREQAAPDPVSLAMCQDLLTVDNEASLMWLMEEQTLCTLLRLSHILTTYPITCLVGGWSHLPLLSLAGKLLAGSSGGELNLLHGVSVEALEQQLLQKMQPLPSKRKLHKQKAQKKSDGSGLRLVAVNELDFPAQAPEAFLAREQRRFFRLGAGGMEEPTKTFLEDEEDEQKRLVVICRSPSSLEDLVARCGFLRQTLVATFHILPPAALQQVALVYLGNKLTSKIDLSALPKLHKKLLNKSMARAGRSSVKKGRGTTTDDGKIWQQAMFIPLARIVEMVHLRIRDVVSAEVGQDYALDFCCAVRFSGFVQAIARLAMHFRTLQVHRGTMHESVLSRLKALDKFVLEVEAKYRSNRVSLRLLAEEARRLLDRTARETELRSAARACLQEVKGRKKVVESHIAAVDAKYGAELERALNAACSSLRQLKQLDRCHFQNLAQYRHMPAALVRVLGAAKAMLLHIEEPSDGAPVQSRAVPKHALPAATAAAAGPIGIPQESKPPSRAEMFDWAKTLAAAETLDTLSAAAAGQALPGWLAEVLEKFLACPDCEASQLWAMSPAAARISQWLRARLACHRVLMRMEDERQSMGDLSSQLVEVNASLATAKAELRRAERALEDLEAAHLATVQQRQTLGRSETSLQLQLERAQQVLEIAAPRRRECQVLVPEILESEESPAQWGAILTIAVLSCYGAAFGPALRLPVMKELQQVLQDCGVPTPPNLFTSAYLQHFLPRSFLEAYRWPDCNLFQSALATEVRFGSLCTLMLDPFGIATDWLKALGAAPGGKLTCTPNATLAKIAASLSARQWDPRFGPAEVGESELLSWLYLVWLMDDEPTEWEALPKANDKELQPLVCNASDSPEMLTCKLQYCMRQGSAMIIQLEEVQHLQGFVGTLLVLLSGNSQVRLTTNRHTVLFNLSQRFTRASPASGGGPNGVEAETEELKIHIFSLLQRLEAALPLAHRRFHLYVISPSCPSRCLWGPSKVKTQQLFQVPSAIWSSCCIVSMDVEPSHAAQAFLPILQAKDERHQRQLVLRAQETRLLVIEELLLHLLGKMENSDLQSDKVVVPLQQLSACAARLAISTGVPSGSRKFLPLARSVALLQSVLVDTELLFEAFKGEVALTENHSMRPSVKDLLQQLLKLQSPEEAVMQLLEKLMQALPPQRALLFRQLLVGRETGVPLDWQGTAQLLVKVREDSEKEAKQRSQP